METRKGQPVLPFASAAEWEAWLEENHASSGGLWIRFAKKGSGIPSVTHAEALDAALCHGWIDGQTASVDGDWFLQRFTPRRPRSRWSRINCARAEELAAAGRMRPAGQAEMDAAKADGRWEAAYAGQKSITVPDDLRAKLDEHPRAREFFAGLDSKNRYAVLYRIHDAKKPETRARRIEQFVAMLNEGKKLH
jgi:uncharacterized protein YdeI (YjbR/CyaY-like superfamily)